MKVSIRDVVRAMGGKLILGNPKKMVSGVSTDTRSLKRGDLFVALRGERFDGHTYLQTALQRGAAGVVVSRSRSRKAIPSKKNKAAVIEVADTLRALGDLASFWRGRFKIPVVAVTGSNGKTTTKEMIAAILSKKYRVLKSHKNFNNLIGLPATLFQLKRNHQAVVLEMGMNHPGEIDRLAEIAHPTVGVITNVGRAHLKGLGSLRRIARANGELLGQLPRTGTAFLNKGDRSFGLLRKMVRSRLKTFGTGGDYEADSVQLEDLKGIRFRLKKQNRCGRFFLKTLGRHNVTNALAAIGVGSHLGVSIAAANKALNGFRASDGRMQVVPHRRFHLINDSYNANPESMISALHFLKEAGEQRRKVAILGDMFELGRATSQGHQEVGLTAGRLGIDLLIAVGPHAGEVCRGALKGGLTPRQVRRFSRLENSFGSIRALLCQEDLILVKGSRGMRMEKLIERIQ